VAGGELFDRICDKTTYTEAEARDLVITLLKVLAYLHSRKIAHRDLKPENLLLRSKKNDTDIVLAGAEHLNAWAFLHISLRFAQHLNAWAFLHISLPSLNLGVGFHPPPPLYLSLPLSLSRQTLASRR